MRPSHVPIVIVDPPMINNHFLLQKRIQNKHKKNLNSYYLLLDPLDYSKSNKKNHSNEQNLDIEKMV
jgi:hypothetical protein